MSRGITIASNLYNPLGSHVQLEVKSLQKTQQQIAIIGCGDLGERLSQRLQGNRYQVLGLRRSTPAAGHNLEYRCADFNHPDSLRAALDKDCELVVLTLTPASYSDADYRQAYVQGSGNLLAALRANGCRPRLLLFVSSTSVYAQNSGEWIDEHSATAPQAFSGRRLLEAEQLLANSEFTTLILRCSGIYGPGRQRLLQRVWQGEASAVNSYSNRIHADDCAAAMAHLIEAQRRGHSLAPIYIASDCEPVLMSELYPWLAEKMQRPRPVVSQTAVSGKRCSNRLLRDSGFEFTYPDYRSGYAQLLAEFMRNAGSADA